jgi:hypothetical protein
MTSKIGPDCIPPYVNRLGTLPDPFQVPYFEAGGPRPRPNSSSDATHLTNRPRR